MYCLYYSLYEVMFFDVFLSFPKAVNVTCGVDLIVAGYSTATFQFVEIGIGNPSVGPFFGNVPFRCS